MGPALANAEKNTYNQHEGVHHMTQEIIAAVVGVAGASVVGLLGIIAKWLWNIRNVLTDVKFSDNRRSEQMKTLFTVQVLQIQALKTIIEVVGRGEKNGNVDRALADMALANDALQHHASNCAWR